MWQILETQSETIRTGLAELFGRDREEIAIEGTNPEAVTKYLFDKHRIPEYRHPIAAGRTGGGKSTGRRDD